MTSTDERLAAEAALAHLRHRRRFTPGAAFYQIYHRPRGWWKRQRAAGLAHAWRGTVAKRQLLHRVCNSTPAPLSRSNDSAGALPLDLLTGRGFYLETILTARSLARASGLPLALHFHDDGTLGPAEVSGLQRWFPGAVLHPRAEIEARLAERLPPARFPILHALRQVYVPIKKLTDLAAPHSGERLYVDSDVLFFRRPDELLGHLAAHRPFHLVDTVPSYGAPTAFLAQLADRPVHPQINSGLYFRDVDGIDWEFVEQAARRQLAQFGFSYFIEQALAALLFAREGAVALGADYVVLPAPAECERPTRIVHHYVNQSRWGFYVNARRALAAES